MPDQLFEGLKPRIYSVTELNEEMRFRLEERGEVWVRGEISNLRIPASGHTYFTLKDALSQIRVVMFRAYRSQLRFELAEGKEVLILGRTSMYTPRGEYQLIGEYLEPLGLGALALAFEELKRRLEFERLFAPERKRPLPLFPRRVGIITSRTGAVIRDMLKVLKDREIRLQIYLYPVRVQGPGAAPEIARALSEFNRLPLSLDLLILARGGGSLEDLWAFNEEEVARALAASGIPVISAVGHEVDYTISDFVADLRAPTPTAAASLLADRVTDFTDSLLDFERRAGEEIRRRIEVEKKFCEGIISGVRSPLPLIKEKCQRVDEFSERLGRAMRNLLASRREQLAGVVRVFESLSPFSVLERGYAIATREETREVVYQAGQLRTGEKVGVRFARGSARCEVLEVKTK
ncbi:MAG: exodeoxyribonuclease VII large subunit [Proteobacteria bacterium]|nr:exodeoxyribonuclease VII large subunit [Pseudomonadota bacterium]